MNFYFCETCGKRITDGEIQAGQGRDKKLKGVYCSVCAAGVLTMETLPLTDDAARKILAQPGAEKTPLPKRNSGDKLAAARAVHAPHPDTTGKSEAAPTFSIGLVIAASAVLVVVALALLSGGGSSPGPAAQAPAPAPLPIRPQDGLPQPAPLPRPDDAAVREPEAEPARIEQTRQPQLSTEELARAAFEKLERFEGLAAGDAAGRRGAVEDFLKNHGASLIAARARVLLESLKESDQLSLAGPAKQPPALPDTEPAPATTATSPAPAPDPAPVARKPEDAAAAYEEFTVEYLALLRNGDRAGAAARLARAEKNDALTPLAAAVRRDRKLLDWLAEIEDAAPKGAAQAKLLESFELRRTKAPPLKTGRLEAQQIVEVSNGALMVGTSKMAFPVPFAQLTPETVLRLGMLGLGDDALGLLRRSFALLLGLGEAGVGVEQARQTVERARAAGAAAEDVELTLSKLAAAGHAAREAEAEELSAQFERHEAVKSWAEAARAGQAALARYPGSAALRRREGFATRVAAAVRLGAPVQEYTITLQEGAPVPELGFEKYQGTRDAVINGGAGHKATRYTHALCENALRVNGGFYASLLNFLVFEEDGGALPAASEILDAKLCLYKQADDATFDFKPLTEPWAVDEVTWGFPAKGRSWTKGGSEAVEGPGFQITAAAPAGWIEANCTESLRAMHKAGKRHGWRITTPSGPIRDYICLNSSRYPEQALRPKLVLKVRGPKLAYEAAAKPAAPLPPPPLPGGLREYTLTLQEGQPVLEAGVAKYQGTFDANIYQPHSDIRKGSPPELFVGEPAAGAFLGFTIFQSGGGPLPDRAEILDAKVCLYNLAYWPVIELKRVIKPWKPAEVTWNNAHAKLKWDTPGGDFFPTPSATCVIIKELKHFKGWCELDVTQSLRAMQKEGTNYGWRICTNVPGNGSAVKFPSSTYEKDPALRPKLVLRFRSQRLPGDRK